MTLGPWWRAVAGPRAAERRFASVFSALFSDPPGARDIGRRYLALFPDEADALGLLASLALDREAASPARMRARLALQRRADFASGGTVVLEGWILARSELRACALLAMLPRG